MAEDTIIYKSIGSLLVRTNKTKITGELNEKKELLNMRVKVLSKQEERLRGQIKDLQAKIQKDLRPITPP
jgi:prefoldin beta subunit